MRKIWVDKDRFIPFKEELYAKSGKLLERTEFIVDEIELNKQIEEYIFIKAALK